MAKKKPRNRHFWLAECTAAMDGPLGWVFHKVWQKGPHFGLEGFLGIGLRAILLGGDLE